MSDALLRLGWDPSLEPFLSSDHEPGRVIADHGHACIAATHSGEVEATLASSFRSVPADDRPTVGDFVAIRTAADRSIVTAVLPRRTAIRRTAAGGTSDAQVLAANVDVVGCTIAANLDRPAARIERAVLLAWEAGATPIVVLTKADLIEDPSETLGSLAVLGADVVATSVATGTGIGRLRELFTGKTGVFLGPSGVGKSSLVNQLVEGRVQTVGAERASDHRGRHTTTSRALLPMPNGGAIIDTPGLREVRLWGGDGLDRLYEDVDGFAEQCRFRDCAHEREPGCAVRAAIEDGSLDEDRLHRWHRMRREAVRALARRDERVRLEQHRELKARMRRMSRQARARPRS